MQSKRIRNLVILLFFLFNVAMVTGTALAATNFLPYNYSGPVFLGTSYQFTVEVYSMSNPDKLVCLTYSASTGGGGTLPCVCQNPTCNPNNKEGTWVCTIPTVHADAYITWDMSGWTAGSGGTCGAQATEGPAGDFNTGPTAVVLTGLSTVVKNNQTGLLLTSGLVLLGLVAGGVALRSRRQ